MRGKRTEENENWALREKWVLLGFIPDLFWLIPMVTTVLFPAPGLASTIMFGWPRFQMMHIHDA